MPIDYFPKSDFRPPRGTATVGLWLFLAALFMLFAAGLMGYVYIRVVNPSGNATVPVHLPWLLWLSTGLLLVVSFAIHRALVMVRREKQAAFRLWLQVVLAAAAGFLVAQVPSMLQLLSAHAAVKASGTGVYGLIFFLVLLHALHVVGGIIALALVTVHGFRGAYDHEHYLPVKHAALYWHFLDAVWVVLFGTFLVVG